MLLCHVLEKNFNINSSEMAAECIKMFGISDIAETVAMRIERDLLRDYVEQQCSR